MVRIKISIGIIAAIIILGVAGIFVLDHKTDRVIDMLEETKKYSEEIICFYTKNDPYVKYEVEKDFADNIATKQIVIDDGGHLNSESGYTEFAQLLEYL